MIQQVEIMAKPKTDIKQKGLPNKDKGVFQRVMASTTEKLAEKAPKCTDETLLTKINATDNEETLTTGLDESVQIASMVSPFFMALAVPASKNDPTVKMGEHGLEALPSIRDFLLRNNSSISIPMPSGVRTEENVVNRFTALASFGQGLTKSVQLTSPQTTTVSSATSMNDMGSVPGKTALGSNSNTPIMTASMTSNQDAVAVLPETSSSNEAPTTAGTLMANPLSMPEASPDIPNRGQTQPVEMTMAAPIDEGDLAISSAPNHVLEPTQNEKQSTGNLVDGNEINANVTSAAVVDSEQVVVTVSDASTRIDKPVFQQVTDQVLIHYDNKKSEFQMDLCPEHLGKVSVKLSMENQVLTIAILADDPKTQSLLLSHSREIQSVLQATANQPVQVVEAAQDKAGQQQAQDSMNQSQSQQQQQQDQQQQRDGELNWETYQNSIGSTDFMTVMQQLKMRTYST